MSHHGANKRIKLDAPQDVSEPHFLHPPSMFPSNSVDETGLSQPEVGDESICSICCCAWTVDGPHRIACLPCGHVFGRSCVEKWVTTQKTCPSCKVKCALKEFRNLFVNKIVAMDSIERANLKSQIAVEQSSRARAEQQVAQLQTRLKAAELRCSLLQDEVKTMKRTAIGISASGSSLQESAGALIAEEQPAVCSAFNLKSECSIDLMKSRVLEYLPSDRWVLASTQLSNGRWGVRRISILDPRNHQDLIDLGHSDAIRDMKLSPQDSSSILSVSMDRTLKITNVRSKNCVLSINQPDSALWSCCWDESRPNFCFAGAQTGAVYVFDIRKPTGAVIRVSPQHPEPIHSLSFSPARTSGEPCLITGSMGGIFCWSIESMFSSRRLSGANALEQTQLKCVGLGQETDTGFYCASFRSSLLDAPDVVAVSANLTNLIFAHRSQVAALIFPPQTFDISTMMSTLDTDQNSERSLCGEINFSGRDGAPAAMWSLQGKSSSLSRPSCFKALVEGVSRLFCAVSDEGQAGISVYHPSSQPTVVASAPLSGGAVLDSKAICPNSQGSIFSTTLWSLTASKLHLHVFEDQIQLQEG